MNKIKLFFILVIVALIGFSGCSKKGTDKIIGKWKAADNENPQMKDMQVEVNYEFTKDKIIEDAKVHGEQQPKMEIAYVLKANIGDTIVLEATHPQTQQKGDFKIVFNGDKMMMTDPGMSTLTLVKQ